MKKLVSILGFAALLGLLTTTASAAVPGEITIQGQLTDSLGQPLPAGNNAFGFYLFDSEFDGDVVWQEYFGLANGEGGLWVARLGTINPLSPQILDGSVRWLEIHVEIGDDPEVILTPRIPIVSTAYAIRVATIDGATGGVVTGSVITGQDHTVSGANVFVAGESNEIDGDHASIAGGLDNIAIGPGSFIGGGHQNEAGNASVGNGFVGSGEYNIAGMESAIGSGRYNEADEASFVGGGLGNGALGVQSAVVGGHENGASAIGSFVGGGFWNQARGDYSVVCGGGRYEPRDSNLALGPLSFVGGGGLNFATGDHSAIVGGEDNLASGQLSAVGGGLSNRAAGLYSSVPGGYNNLANDTGSMAVGTFAICSHPHTFVWGDGRSDVEEATSSAPNQFLIRASNGVRFSRPAGEDKAIELGDHYRDNGIVAWGRVRSDGLVSTYEFGVASVVRNSTGNYTVTLDITASSTNNVIVTATPELETAPSSAATLRIASVNQVSAGMFDVYINTGAGIAVDNDFMFMVTAR